MPNSPHRKPIGNFFIKRSLQFRLIGKILFAALISTLVFAATLLIVYYLKYKSVAFYRVILDQNMDIPPRENIIFIILPTLLISVFVNVIAAFIIGVYASRKYALPIYKLEQWADFLKGGQLNAKLRFREREEFQELTQHCNSLGEFVRNEFHEIKKEIAALPDETAKLPQIQNIQERLSKLALDSDTLEVHTGLFRFTPEELKKRPS